MHYICNPLSPKLRMLPETCSKALLSKNKNLKNSISTFQTWKTFHLNFGRIFNLVQKSRSKESPEIHFCLSSQAWNPPTWQKPVRETDEEVADGLKKERFPIIRKLPSEWWIFGEKRCVSARLWRSNYEELAVSLARKESETPLNLIYKQILSMKNNEISSARRIWQALVKCCSGKGRHVIPPTLPPILGQKNQ